MEGGRRTTIMSSRSRKKQEPSSKFYEVQERPSAEDVRERVSATFLSGYLTHMLCLYMSWRMRDEEGGRRKGERDGERKKDSGIDSLLALLFYFQIVGQSRKAGRSLAALETARPVTPMDSSRGLFGASRRSSSTSAGSRDRPTSAFPMGRKQFLQDLPGSSQMDDIATSRPGSVVSLGGERSERRGSIHAARLAPMPPMTPPPGKARAARRGDVGSPASSKRAMPRPPDRAGSAEGGAAAAGAATPPRPPTAPRPPTGTPRTPGGRSSRLPSRSSSADTPRVSSAQHQDHQTWAAIESVIAELNPADQPSTEELGASCDRLRAVIAANNPLTNGRRKNIVLRSLFQLLELSDSRLLLKVVRTILQVDRKGSTLTNACKLIFKLSRDARNDELICEEKIGSLLVSVLQSTDRQRDGGALVYCCGAVKNISSDTTMQKQLAKANIVEAISASIRDILSYPQADVGKKHTSDLLIQMSASLRNLSGTADLRQALLASRVADALFQLIPFHSGDVELMVNLSRIFSKLTLHTQCRSAISEIPGAIGHIVDLVIKHKTNLPLAVRLLFSLGNLTAGNEENRELLFECSKDLEVLFNLLSYYIELDKKTDTSAVGATAAPAVCETEDTLVKLIRVIANLCIHPEIGPSIAASPRVTLLSSLLKTKAARPQSQELVLNIVGAINNISFYRHDDNQILGLRLEIAESLVHLLYDENMDVVIETARVFGNFSQEPEVRELLRSKQADELMVVLLEHANREVVFTVCGVLMNLMGDDVGREKLRSTDVLENLTDVLAQAGSFDWQLAGMICKTLWNFSDGVSNKYASASECFGDVCGNLMETLTELLDEEQVAADAGDEGTLALWREDFLPVGQHLLDAMRSRP